MTPAAWVWVPLGTELTRHVIFFLPLATVLVMGNNSFCVLTVITWLGGEPHICCSSSHFPGHSPVSSSGFCLGLCPGAPGYPHALFSVTSYRTMPVTRAGLPEVISCVTLWNLPKLSVPPCPHLQSRPDHSFSLLETLRGLHWSRHGVGT